MAGSVRRVPLRKCTGCQQMKGKKELLRVLRTPEGDFAVDGTGRKNGRGAYLCPTTECFEKARKSKGLERSLKVKIPEEIYEALKREIEGVTLEE